MKKGEYMQKELPIRKHPRLKEYDYSQNGYYYITICTEDNLPILAKIVGRGLAPAEAKVELTAIGKIVEEQLLEIPKRYQNVKIDKYVIMPTHIHSIVIMGETAEASLRPTLMDVVRVFKSMSTRLCNIKENIQGRKIWQTSFYDEIIRNEKAYSNIWRYIDENPAKWAIDKLLQNNITL